MKSKDNNYDLNNWFRCKDKLFKLNNTNIMGVLNVTPDSFYEGSRNALFDDAILHATRMIEAGADSIDIGGVSTRRKANLLSLEEELNRVIPVVKEVRRKFPDIIISIDTFRAEVARAAVQEGANIINDVYGGRYDDKMFDVVAELEVPYVLMHSRGDAGNMQELCSYEDVVEEVCLELSKQIEILRSKGVKDIIIDPGFGFAKTLEQNYQLLRGMNYLKILNCPVLIGVSRKSMIYNLLNLKPKDALNGTTVLNTVAMMNNAFILRVHDVEEAVQLKQLILALNN